MKVKDFIDILQDEYPEWSGSHIRRLIEQKAIKVIEDNREYPLFIKGQELFYGLKNKD